MQPFIEHQMWPHVKTSMTAAKVLYLFETSVIRNWLLMKPRNEKSVLYRVIWTMALPVSELGGGERSSHPNSMAPSLLRRVRSQAALGIIPLWSHPPGSYTLPASKPVVLLQQSISFGRRLKLRFFFVLFFLQKAGNTELIKKSFWFYTHCSSVKQSKNN